jgi:hypothetical protein
MDCRVKPGNDEGASVKRLPKNAAIMVPAITGNTA